jgi:hypothetical protein
MADLAAEKKWPWLFQSTKNLEDKLSILESLAKHCDRIVTCKYQLIDNPSDQKIQSDVSKYEVDLFNDVKKLDLKFKMYSGGRPQYNYKDINSFIFDIRLRMPLSAWRE